jgi:pyridoxal phosphate enzyme (YggS family)
MHNSVKNLLLIKDQIEKYNSNIDIIAVSKTFNQNDIMPLVEFGHMHFGENKVQEAQDKWPKIKMQNNNINLHMIGKLQTNKVKFAVKLFDYIHSVDNIKLAKKIAEEQKKINRDLKIFIQINIGNEEQKSGINKSELKEFYLKCSKEYRLNIIGLMCLPPSNKNSVLYFKEMEELNKFIGLKKLSMGMSADYLDAIKYGSSHIRIGSKIFGSRN